LHCGGFNLPPVNLPNVITIIRLFLVPVFVYFAFKGTDTGRLIALVTFVVASLSDIVDGYIARKRGLVTRLGEFLDPLADKILVLAALVFLIENRTFPVIVALVIFFREIAVQILRNRIVARGGTLPASPAGKIKTVVQIVMVSWWLAFTPVGVGHWVLLAGALAATLWSGAEYFLRFNRLQEVS